MKAKPKKTPSKKQPATRKPVSRREAHPAQPSPPKSVYNPRGLKVADILSQIRRAYEYTSSFPEEFSPSPCTSRATRILSMDNADTSPSEQYGGRAMIIRSWNLLDADEKVIEPGDEKLAAEICQQPMRLFFSDTHADAVARWMYGKSNGVRDGTRSKAGKHLKIAFPPRPGKPVNFRGDTKLLRVAYDDLVSYGDGLRKCLRDTNQIDVLAAHFPDYSEVKKYYTCDPQTLIGARAKDIPTGIQLAESIFAYLVDWSHTQIQKKLLHP